MFERFTDRARKVMSLAQAAAIDLEHSQIGTGHLLLGLVQEGEGVGGKVLASFGLTSDGVRQRLAREPRGAERGDPDRARRRIRPGPAKPPFSAGAKKVLEMSLREALKLGHNYIGTEHMLLGLTHMTGQHADILQSAGATNDRVRERVLERLQQYTSARVFPDRARRSSSGPEEPAPSWSPAAAAALEVAGLSSGTTAALLLALIEDPRSQAGLALSGLGITPEKLKEQLDLHPVESTSDAQPAPEVEISVGDKKLVVRDARLAAIIEEASAEQVSEFIRKAFGGEAPGDEAGQTG